MNLPLLLLHGAIGSQEQFEGLPDSLPGGRPVYRLDFPGHGPRAGATDMSIPLFADAVLDFLQENNLAQVNIFGYSMGGYVALYLAVHHPTRVGRIMTLGTKFDWTPETAAKEVAMLNPEKIEEKVPAFAQALARRHGDDHWKTVLHQTAALLRGLGENPPLTADTLARVPHEVAVCRGALDQMVTEQESRWAAAQLPNGKYVELEDTKHPIEMVDKERLWKKLS